MATSRQVRWCQSLRKRLFVRNLPGVLNAFFALMWDDSSIIFLLFTPQMSLRSFQWPFLWSFYVPLPCPLCALVNVRRTRRMDGCVNPVGDVRDDNSCGHVSRMYETYRLWIMCNLAVKKKKDHLLPVSFWVLQWWWMAAKPIEQTHIQMERKE